MDEKTSKNEIELTEKQKAFCRYYVFDWNGTQSAIKAGYSEKTAYSIASENLRKPEIQAYIKKLCSNDEEYTGISKRLIIAEHKKIALSSMSNIHDTWITRKEFETLTDIQKDCIQEIDTKIKTEYEYNPETEKKEPIEVEYIKVKLYDKQKSLDAISKLLGYEAPTKIDLKSIIELPQVKIGRRNRNTTK
jgi:phage terminase small subunit